MKKHKGPGRPKKEPTEVMRVPKSLVKKFKSMIKEHRESQGGDIRVKL